MNSVCVIMFNLFIMLFHLTRFERIKHGLILLWEAKYKTHLKHAYFRCEWVSCNETAQ